MIKDKKPGRCGRLLVLPLVLFHTRCFGEAGQKKRQKQEKKKKRKRVMVVADLTVPCPELHLQSAVCRQGLLSRRRRLFIVLPSAVCWHYFLQWQRTPALSHHLTFEHSSSSLLSSLRRSLSPDIRSHEAVAAAATAALGDVTVSTHHAGSPCERPAEGAVIEPRRRPRCSCTPAIPFTSDL